MINAERKLPLHATALNSFCKQQASRLWTEWIGRRKRNNLAANRPKRWWKLKELIIIAVGRPFPGPHAQIMLNGRVTERIGERRKQ